LVGDLENLKWWASPVGRGDSENFRQWALPVGGRLRFAGADMPLGRGPWRILGGGLRQLVEDLENVRRCFASWWALPVGRGLGEFEVVGFASWSGPLRISSGGLGQLVGSSGGLRLKRILGGASGGLREF
jgi:hypothetical protein